MAPSLNEYSNHVIETPLQIVQPVCVNSKSIELLNRINGNGLSAEYRFTRTPHLYSAKMANLNVTFRNNTNDFIEDIKLVKKVCKICTYCVFLWQKNNLIGSLIKYRPTKNAI